MTFGCVNGNQEGGVATEMISTHGINKKAE